MRSGTGFLGSLCGWEKECLVTMDTVPWTLQNVVFPRSNQPQCGSLPVSCTGKEGLVTFVTHVLVLCRNAKPIVMRTTV